MNEYEKRKIALEFARTLDDLQAINLYEMFLEKYSVDLLRQILHKVMLIPDHKIKRTRGALFNYLVQQHENSKRYNSRY